MEDHKLMQYTITNLNFIVDRLWKEQNPVLFNTSESGTDFKLGVICAFEHLWMIHSAKKIQDAAFTILDITNQIK